MSRFIHCFNHFIFRPLVQGCNLLARGMGKKLLAFASLLLHIHFADNITKRIALVFLAFFSVALWATPVAAAFLIEYQAPADPTTEGFSPEFWRGSQVNAPIANDLGYPAWSISTLGLNSVFDYKSGALNAAQKADINSQGFTLTLRGRVLKGNALAYDAGYNTVIAGTLLELESTNYNLGLGINSSGNTVAVLITYYDFYGPGGSVRAYGPSYTLNDAGYHTYDLVFNPHTQSASLFVDGVERISGYTGDSVGSLNRGLIFGAEGGGGMNFNLVRLTSPAVVCNSGLIGETLQICSSYEFSLEQGTQKAQFIQLINPGTVSRSATLEIVNPHAGLTVSLTQPNPITLVPGETKTLSINLDAGTTPVGVYDDLLLKVTADDGSTLYSSIKVYVVQPGAGPLPDLAISAKDIRSATNADGTVTLTADVHNQGTAPASHVQVQFYEFDTALGEPVIAQISPNGIGSASITVPAMTAGDHLIRVVIDPSGAIQELDKTNNEASQIVRIGSPSPTTEGNILVTGSLPSTVYAGSLFTLTGQAVYAINVNGTTNTDYVVKGGAVQVTVEGGAVYGDIHTDVNGNFTKFLLAPALPGTYRISMTVTDQTFSGTRELVFNVIEAPAPGSPPPSPPSPPTGPGPNYGTGNWTFDPPSGTWTWTWTTPPTTPIPDSDLRVFSEDIHFSKNNPAANEEITLFAEIHYWASSTTLVAKNVPVNLYVTPVTDPATPRMKIGQTVIASLSVGSPDFGSRYVYATWKNSGQGIYIVEVEIDPSYVEDYMLNNAATRAIIVGQVPNGLGAISGQVTNPLGGMGNVVIHVRNASGTEIGNALTDQTGAYLVKDIPLNTLEVHIDTPTGYIVVALDTETQTVTISNNEPVGTVNFHLAKQTGDTTPPVLSLPAAITAEATGSSGAVVAYTASATDAVDGAITPTCTPTSGSTFPLGVTIVNCTATDQAGNTASGSFTVTVRDTTPPTLVCPHNINIVQGQPLDLGTPTVSDAVDTTPMLSNNAPTSFPIGTTAVTWTATDKAGNQASCVQQVTIVAAPANQPPIANAGLDRTVRQGSLVTLNGSGFDPDNGPSPLTFSWSQTGGSSVTLNGASTANPTFIPSTKGTYVFSLVVNDGTDNSAPSSVQITVPLLCDIDLDGDVDRNDISLITVARNQPAGPNDIRDYDGDGTITVNDARACVLKCTRSNCATQ